jgi:hypothetical protein
MSAQYEIQAHLIQEWRKTCCEIRGLIRYVLNNEIPQQCHEGSMTVAYVFIQTAITLDVGRIIIMWHQAYRRHIIIEHSSLKVNSVRRWIYLRTALHSNVADNDWSHIPHLSIQEKTSEHNGTVHQLFRGFRYADNNTVHSLQQDSTVTYFKLRNGATPRTTVLL